MKTLKITKDQLDRARIREKEINNLKNSVTNGRSAIYGSLGEVVVEDYFKDKAKVECENTYDYDMKINGKKIEVKTKKTTVIPKSHYTCTVFSYNARQNCDYYLFVRIKENFSEAYILGCIYREDFYKKATFRKKGINYDGKMTSDDCYNVKISDLIKL